MVDNAADFYSSRTTKKQKGNTLVEELLRDSEFKKYTKNKFLVSTNWNRRNPIIFFYQDSIIVIFLLI